MLRLRSAARPDRACAIGLAALMMTTALTAVAPATPAYAQAVPEAAERSFDIPAQPLTEALIQFGRQAGLQASADAALMRNLRSAPVRGTMTWQRALTAMLSGTGLTWRLNGSMVALEKLPRVGDAAIALDPVTVEGQAGSPPQAEIGNLPPEYAGGQVARGGKLGILGNTDIMDAPFNITSFTDKTIADQQARTVADVTANDPSVRATASSGGMLDSFFIRGFPINEGNFGEIALNGTFGVAPTYRLFTDYAERVEVIKGPTALLNGIAPNSGVGGTINIVPKRAPDEDLARFTTDYASDRQGGGHLDLSRRFGTDRRFGVRLNGSYHAGDTAIDNQWREAPVGALALDYRGDRLRATIDLIAQREKFEAPQRPLFPTAGIAIPDAPDGRSNLQQSWERSQTDDLSGLGRIEYDLSDNLTLFAAGGAGDTRVERLFGTPTLLNSAGDVSVTPQNFIFEVDGTTAEAGLRARFDTASINHSLTLQANRLHQRLGRGFNSGTAQSTNIYDPVARSQQNVPEPASVPKVSENELVGLALADTMSIFDERVQLTLGVRRQHVDSKNFSSSTGAVTSSSDEAVFTPLVGLVVKPWKNVAVYANYVEGLSIGQVAPGTAINAGETLPPARSKQIEVGTKIDFGRFGVSLSAFQIEKPFGQLENTGGGLVFSEAGEQRNRGVEFNLFGEAAPGLRLLGGVALLDGELTKTTSATTQGNTPIGIPSVQLNLGAEWDASFAPGLTLAGNVIYTDEQSVDTANTQEISSWTRLDLSARYRTTFVNTPLTFRATVQNVFDTDYWAGVASFGTLAQGAPRTVLLSVTADF